LINLELLNSLRPQRGVGFELRSKLCPATFFSWVQIIRDILIIVLEIAMISHQDYIALRMFLARMTFVPNVDSSPRLNYQLPLLRTYHLHTVYGHRNRTGTQNHLTFFICSTLYQEIHNANLMNYTYIFDPTLGSMGKWLFVAALILAMKAETMGHRACIISNRNMRLPVHVAYDTPVRSRSYQVPYGMIAYALISLSSMT